MRNLPKAFIQVINNFVQSRDLIDYAITIKPTEAGINNEIIVLYIISAIWFKTEDLLAALRQITQTINLTNQQEQNHTVTIEIVEVSNIPRNQIGEIDYTELSNFPILNAELVRRWEASVKKCLKIKQFATLIRPFSDRVSPFHLSDLITERQHHKLKTLAKSQTKSQRSHNSSIQNKTSTIQKPAISHGGVLVVEEGKAKTLVEALQKTVDQYPTKGITYIEYNGNETFQTYPELYKDAQNILAGLQKNNLKAGDYVILQLTSMQDHFCAFWACVLGGIIPVAVAVPSNYQDTTAISKLTNTLDLLPDSYIIANDELVDSIKHIEAVKPAGQIRVLPINQLRQSTEQGIIYPCNENDVIFHQLTSGSTGHSKCVQIRHKGVIAHINAVAQFNDYSSDDVSLNWLPLDHVAPILMCHLKDVYLGMQHIVVKTERILANPLRWLDYMEKFHVTHSWSPNFGFKLINDCLSGNSNATWQLQHIKELMNAGEQVTLKVVKDFLKFTKPFGITQKVVQPAYGMAETCTAITYRHDFDLDNEKLFHKTATSDQQTNITSDANELVFMDLGLPLPGVEIRITDNNNLVLNEGEIGHLQVKGNVVTPGYLNNDQANQDVFQAGGWFDTGDLGFIKNNSLTITGREKEMIVIQGANYYCYDIETVVEQVNGVEITYVGTSGVIDPTTGAEVLAVFFVPTANSIEQQIKTIKDIRKKVSSSIGITPTYIIPLEKSMFPKTTSGKIQRGALKKSFQSNIYKHICQEIDIQLGNQNTLPRWFFERYWQKNNGDFLQLNDIGDVLIFASQSDFSTNLVEILATHQPQIILVEKGKFFERIEQHKFKINPHNEHDYTHLFKLLNGEFKITHILHFWSYSNPIHYQPLSQPEHEHIVSDMSAIYITKTLATDENKKPVSLYFIANYSQQLDSAELLVADKAYLLGLVRTIHHENSHIRTRHIDVDCQINDSLANHIVTELLIAHSPEEVIYRNGQRITCGLRRIDTIDKYINQDLLVDAGVYLVTGGMGGVGFELCKYLLEEYDASLIIVGRTPVNDVVESDKYKLLQRISDRLIYVAADVCDREALESTIQLSDSAFGSRLDGIFHLAGVYHDQKLAQEDQESLRQITDVKIRGARNLANLLHKHNPDGLFVSFSSILTYFGGSMVGAYSAGNRFLEAFTLSLRQQTTLKSFCLAWSNWDHLGMSQGYSNIQARGYEAISIQQGLISLIAALRINNPLLYIGLDDSKTNVSVHCIQPPQAKAKLCGYYTADQSFSPDDIHALAIRDIFGTPTQCDLILRDSLPVKPNEEIDKAKLEQVLTSDLKVNEIPQSKTERSLISIWKSVLEIENIGLRDNFFEIGGSSLTMSILLGEMSRCFEKDFTIIEFFQHPTIATMAAYINNSQTKDDAKNIRQAHLKKRQQLQQRRVAQNRHEIK